MDVSSAGRRGHQITRPDLHRLHEGVGLADTLVQSPRPRVSDLLGAMSTRGYWKSAILAGLFYGALAACAREANMQRQTTAETDPLSRATAWLNTASPTPAALRGKVVLVDFWTYSCINWRRTLPYLRSWHEKYQHHGLVVVGVHTPEFAFEKSLENIRRAVREQAIAYPVAIDSDYEIWDAFDNHYWPALYFIDADGRIRHQQFGEGNYELLESVIVKLLAEAGYALPAGEVSTTEGVGAEVAADWKNLRSPETYVGHSRSDSLASPGGLSFEKPRNYSIPPRMMLNQWALAGRWTSRRDSAALNEANGRIAFRFHARDVHLVMGPGPIAQAIRFRVTLDGQPPRDSRGVDVDGQGYGVVDQPRMYTLIRQSTAIEDRLVEVEFFDPGAEVFVFTFG
jgi:thiol-disulfide isomerase/thioredoxin